MSKFILMFSDTPTGLRIGLEKDLAPEHQNDVDALRNSPAGVVLTLIAQELYEVHNIQLSGGGD